MTTPIDDEANEAFRDWVESMSKHEGTPKANMLAAVVGVEILAIRIHDAPLFSSMQEYTDYLDGIARMTRVRLAQAALSNNCSPDLIAKAVKLADTLETYILQESNK